MNYCLNYKYVCLTLYNATVIICMTLVFVPINTCLKTWTIRERNNTCGDRLCLVISLSVPRFKDASLQKCSPITHDSVTTWLHQRLWIVQIVQQNTKDIFSARKGPVFVPIVLHLLEGGIYFGLWIVEYHLPQRSIMAAMQKYWIVCDKNICIPMSSWYHSSVWARVFL